MLKIFIKIFYLVLVSLLNKFLSDDFVFSPRYRVVRHIVYWSFHILLWAAFWMSMGAFVSYGRQVLNMTMWLPLFIFFGYPLVYGAIPHLLLKGKIIQFFIVVMIWGAAGLYFDEAYRSYIYIPLQQKMGLSFILPGGPLASCYLCMTTSAAIPMVIKFFKLLSGKQKEVLQAYEEKNIAEIQLLRSQVHPHFLFNTLNNIYSFSLLHHIKTPGLIQKLGSLIRYMLFECTADQVKLEREIEILRNYVDLEKERYGNRLRIKFQLDGDFNDVMITPLLVLPFLENAFKHGLSEQIDDPCLDIRMSVERGIFSCYIANSKNAHISVSGHGIGIQNVKKRLELIYPGRHQLQISDKEDLFVVRMWIRFSQARYMHDNRKISKVEERFEQFALIRE